MCADDSPASAGHHHPAAFDDLDPALRIDLQPVDSVTVTTLMDNVTDAFMPDQGVASRARPGGSVRPVATMAGGQGADPLVAEHGFSVLLTVTSGDRTHRLMFDTGTSPDGVVDNMRRLGLDPADVEVIVCSHGHYDHTTGLDGLARTLGRSNMPVVIHPEFWRRRRIVVTGREPRELPTTSRRALQDAGFEVIEERQPSFLFERSVLITGEVPRTTGYEPGFPGQEAWLGGEWAPDPLVLDDQALILNVAGKGLLIMTGCGHAGIVNICRYAQRLTGDLPVYAIMGGFHLNGPVFEPLIPHVIADLSALDPRVVVPAHCTGWRAQHAMAAAFGEAFVPDAVGSRFDL